MEYYSLAKKTLATTIAALALATSSGCMGVGKAFTTFGKSEDTIDRKDDNRSNEQNSAPYTPPVKQEKQDDPKDKPRRNIKPEYRIPAESCYNRRLEHSLTF